MVQVINNFFSYLLALHTSFLEFAVVVNLVGVQINKWTFEYIIILLIDPMGALWPFIGIVVEAIVLVFIIGGYELWKKKQKISQCM